MDIVSQYLAQFEQLRQNLNQERETALDAWAMDLQEYVPEPYFFA